MMPARMPFRPWEGGFTVQRGHPGAERPVPPLGGRIYGKKDGSALPSHPFRPWEGGFTVFATVIFGRVAVPPLGGRIYGVIFQRCCHLVSSALGRADLRAVCRIGLLPRRFRP